MARGSCIIAFASVVAQVLLLETVATVTSQESTSKCSESMCMKRIKILANLLWFSVLLNLHAATGDITAESFTRNAAVQAANVLTVLGAASFSMCSYIHLVTDSLCVWSVYSVAPHVSMPACC